MTTCERIFQCIATNFKTKKMKRFLKYINCRLFSKHDYKMLKFYDRQIQKLECSVCKKQFGINHSVSALVDWDDEIEKQMRLMYPEKI